jgi:hypothetical protein
MPGSDVTYRCDRCPLIFEVGESVAWDDTGTWFRQVQVVCGACGTMHRVTEERGRCQVTALAGPVRRTRAVMLRDVAGAEWPTEEWDIDPDWRAGAKHSDGIKAIDRLACNRCGQVGRMVRWDRLSSVPAEAGQTDPPAACPVCAAPLAVVSISDSI